MSVLLDTGVLVAAANRKESDAVRAIEILGAIAAGKHGASFVTDYIVDEALTLAWVRSKRSKVVLELADWLLAKDPKQRPGRLVFVSEPAFVTASGLHRRHHSRLSFTDCTTLAVAEELRIDSVATLEGGFDGLIGVLR